MRARVSSVGDFWPKLLKVASVSALALSCARTADGAVVQCAITDFGARPLPSLDAQRNTLAINKAVSQCHTVSPDGAEVIVPPGTWLTGSINLTSNLTFRLMAHATLLSTTDESLYAQVPCLPNEVSFPPSRFRSHHYTDMLLVACLVGVV